MKTLSLVVVLAVMTGCASREKPLPGKRVEVVLAEQAAYFWKDGRLLVRVPIASGVGDSPLTTTYRGEFSVHEKDRGPRETSPGVFVRDIVIFDFKNRNAFHSASMTFDGTVLDDTVGRPATAGCIRVQDSDFVYRFIDADTKIIIR